MKEYVIENKIGEKDEIMEKEDEIREVMEVKENKRIRI